MAHLLLVDGARLVEVVDLERQLELLDGGAARHHAERQDELVEVDGPALVLVEHREQALQVRPDGIVVDVIVVVGIVVVGVLGVVGVVVGIAAAVVVVAAAGVVVVATIRIVRQH